MDKHSPKIKKEIDRFKKAINKDPLHSSKWDDFKKGYDDAVYQAYLDAARTFKGIKDVLENAGVKDAYTFLKTSEIHELLSSYFENEAPSDEDTFDNTHQTLCENVIKHFKKINYDIEYGKAQKIVNMSFKYLYCFDDAPEEYFKYCHLPLDSFTLEWIYRNVLSDHKKYQKGKIAFWSKLQKGQPEQDEYRGADGKQYYSYDFYVKKVREYLADTSKEYTPLQLEFKIWQEIQMDLAAEAFWSALNPDADKDEKIKFQEKDTKKKLETIKNCIICLE